MAKPALYAWFDPNLREFRVSRYPADAPVRPSIALTDKADVLAIAKRKRADVIWWPPLPQGV